MAERLSTQELRKRILRLRPLVGFNPDFADILAEIDTLEADNTRLRAEKEHLGTELADAVAQCVQLEKAEEDLTKRLKIQEEWVERWMSTAAQNEADLLLVRAEVDFLKGLCGDLAGLMDSTIKTLHGRADTLESTARLVRRKVLGENKPND